MNEKGEPQVTYRGSKGRLEVEVRGYMFEYNITSGGLIPGAQFADTGFDLRDMNPVCEPLARRAAREWLSEAWLLNPNI